MNLSARNISAGLSMPARFASVGVLNTALGLAVIQIALWLGLGDYAANAAGYAAGFVCSYALNRRFTFGAGDGRHGRQLPRFVLVAGMAYACNLLVLKIGQMAGLSGTIAVQVAAMGTYTAAFYVLARTFVFAEGSRPADGLDDLIGRSYFIAALIVAGMIPAMLAATPPLIDLGGHLARYGVQIDGGASPALRQWYGFDWALLPNLGSDLLVQGLAPVIGLEPAIRVIVAAIAGLHVAGVLLLSRAAHGRVTVTALFALPFAYGFPFQFGFLNFTLSIALALLALAAWIALGRAGRLRVRAVLFVGAGFGLWLCHLVGFAVFGIGAFADGVMRGRAEGRGWVRAAFDAGLAVVPLLAGPLAGMLAAHGGPAPAEAFSYAHFADKIRWLPMALRDAWLAWDFGSVLLVCGLIYWFWRSPAFVRHGGLALAAVLLALAYLAMPDTIMGSRYADMRLVPLIVTLFLVAAAPAPGSGKMLRIGLAIAGLLFAGARLAGNAAATRAHDAQFARSLSVLDAVPRGSNMVTFFLSRCGQGDGWDLDRREHLSGYALVRRGAFDNRQWQMPGGQLLTVHNPDAVPFEHAPAPAMFDRACHGERGLAEALAAVSPRIGTVWVLGYPAGFAAPGWQAVRRAGDSVVLRRLR
ncbi:GtrA family protein [Novosphingobium sp. KCTC 2891]|uniref:GtrA family protein n=1 Tax=Novosphingobium sp. KCTC 2891 TaxID=2989730 RepID=UPI002223686F|nr:GtrA family protein [Novosphingobium sp. KCTC 2891]MCW1383297.1 GtrA family protein [Novosphingobium sp. KCTC 2891]